MPAQLLALDNGISILLDKPILLIGRHPECDIQIDSRKISRRHCCIAQVSDYFIVRDLGSTNGIRINGIRVIEGRLTSGDELTIGNNRYEVSWEAHPVPPAPATGRRPTMRAPSPPAAIADEMLESCEEPVPLEEPAAIPPLPLQKEAPLVLPEELELMPDSGRLPNISSQSSNSPPPA